MNERLAFVCKGILTSAACVRLHEFQNALDRADVSFAVDEGIRGIIGESHHQEADSVDYRGFVLAHPQPGFRRIEIERAFDLFEDRFVIETICNLLSLNLLNALSNAETPLPFPT